MEKLPEKTFSFTASEGEEQKWYQIPKKESSREITVHLPEGAQFFLYDNTDKLVSSSIVKGASDTVKLPEGGKLLLAGKSGDVFKVGQ